MLKIRISDYPTIPTIPANYNTLYYTEGQIDNVIAAYGNTLIYTGSSYLAKNRFRYSMNTFGNFENGFNARFYVSITAKGTDWQTKYCFAAVYMKWNSGTNIAYFKSHIITSNNNTEWSLITGGSTEGIFWLNLDINSSNANIYHIYLRIS